MIIPDLCYEWDEYLGWVSKEPILPQIISSLGIDIPTELILDDSDK